MPVAEVSCLAFQKRSPTESSEEPVGKAREGIAAITKALNTGRSMQKVWSGLGRKERLLLPRAVTFPSGVDTLDTENVLRAVETRRRASVHDAARLGARVDRRLLTGSERRSNA